MKSEYLFKGTPKAFGEMFEAFIGNAERRYDCDAQWLARDGSHAADLHQVVRLRTLGNGPHRFAHFVAQGTPFGALIEITMFEDDRAVFEPVWIDFSQNLGERGLLNELSDDLSQVEITTHLDAEAILSRVSMRDLRSELERAKATGNEQSPLVRAFPVWSQTHLEGVRQALVEATSGQLLKLKDTWSLEARHAFLESIQTPALKALTEMSKHTIRAPLVEECQGLSDKLVGTRFLDIGSIAKDFGLMVPKFDTMQAIFKESTANAKLVAQLQEGMLRSAQQLVSSIERDHGQYRDFERRLNAQSDAFQAAIRSYAGEADSGLYGTSPRSSEYAMTGSRWAQSPITTALPHRLSLASDGYREYLKQPFAQLEATVWRILLELTRKTGLHFEHDPQVVGEFVLFRVGQCTSVVGLHRQDNKTTEFFISEGSEPSTHGLTEKRFVDATRMLIEALKQRGWWQVSAITVGIAGGKSREAGNPGLSHEEQIRRMAKAQEANELRAASGIPWKQVASQIEWEFGSNPAGVKLLEDARRRLKYASSDDLLEIEQIRRKEKKTN